MDETVVSLSCLRCGQDSAMKYHEIFDEVGLELHLKELLEQHFQLYVQQTSTKFDTRYVLCDVCMNQLIELVDIDGVVEESEINITLQDDKSCDPMVEEYLSCEVSPEREDDFDFELLDQTDYEAVAASIDINAYLDRAIKSDLENIKFQWRTICQTCLCEFTTYQELFDHIKNYHKTKDLQFYCVLHDCSQILHNEKMLARHIIFKHSDLRSLQIYGNCPDCELKFSNFINFNKHSCCRTIKRRPGLRNFCKICELDFPSFKRFVFHMQFHLPTQRPKVCLICLQSFNDAALFFEHVQYQHEPKELLACVICDRTFRTKSVFVSHQRRHHLNYKYECKLCPKKYDHKNLLTGHMEAFHDNVNKFICDICEKMFATSFALRKHTKNHGFEAEVQAYVCENCGLIGRDDSDLLEHVQNDNSTCFASKIQQEIMTVAYTCEFCSQDFQTASNLQGHRATNVHKDNLYECPLCKEKFKTLKRMRTHTNSHVTFEAWQLGFPLCRYFMCNFKNCTDTFSQWSSLYYHKKRTHNKYTCGLCNKTFLNEDVFNEHKNECNDKVEHNCQFCGKECVTKMSLAVHIAKSHNNKNVTCDVCKCSYKNESALKEHFDFMHVPVNCSFCYKIIKNKRNYKTHVRAVHKQEHRYFCNLCRKGFFQKSEKEAHVKHVHTDFTLKCAECAFTTNYTKSLEIHIAMHKNEYQFKCPICNKEFGRKHVLDIHIKRHQTQRQYICSNRILNGCKAGFVSNYLLNKHIKEKHSPAKSPSLVEMQEQNTENIVPLNDVC